MVGRSPASILFDLDGEPVNVLVDGNTRRLQVTAGGARDIARGLIDGAAPFNGFGERDSLSIVATGEDIWRGLASIVPTPADAGDAMEVVSSNAADNSTGTGIRTLMVHFLDASGNSQVEIVTMNGTTPVPLVQTNVRFVQVIHAMTVGSNAVAEGVIDLRKVGSPTTIYSMIDLGGNLSLVPHRMVPLGKILVVTSWHCTESKGKRVAYRLRTTSQEGTLYPGVFLFKDSMYIQQDSLESTVLFQVPALAIIKISGWADAPAAEASCSWEGVLYDA